MRLPSKLHCLTNIPSYELRLTLWQSSRTGMQLLELIVSLTSASVLLAGMSAAVLIANRGVQVASTRVANAVKNDDGISRMCHDFAEAFPVSDATATSATLSVPDRNADGSRELIRYRWDGAGLPVQISTNSAPWLDATPALNELSLRYRDVTPQSTPLVGDFDPPGSFIFQGVRAVAGSSGPGVTLPLPETYRPGDLLIAVVAVSSSQTGFTAPSNWTIGPQSNRDSKISLGAMFSTTHSESSVTFSWLSGTSFSAALAHFATPSGTATRTSVSIGSGVSKSASAPQAIASTNNALVIRILAANAFATDVDATNISGHIPVAMRLNGLFMPLAGMAFRSSPAGSIGSAEFGLLTSGPWIASTLVFEP